jgi:hypothetical protein
MASNDGHAFWWLAIGLALLAGVLKRLADRRRDRLGRRRLLCRREQLPVVSLVTALFRSNDVCPLERLIAVWESVALILNVDPRRLRPTDELGWLAQGARGEDLTYGVDCLEEELWTVDFYKLPAAHPTLGDAVVLLAEGGWEPLPQDRRLRLLYRDQAAGLTQVSAAVAAAPTGRAVSLSAGGPPDQPSPRSPSTADRLTASGRLERGAADRCDHG